MARIRYELDETTVEYELGSPDPARDANAPRDFFATRHSIVSPEARIGAGTRIWEWAKVREGAVIGRECVIGQGVYIDHHVTLGDQCKVQNGAFIYSPAWLGDGVFVGPGSMLLNDRKPRARVHEIDPCKRTSEMIKSRAGAHWTPEGVKVARDASIGAGAIIMPGVSIGEGAMIGAGAVVTCDVEAWATVVGVPGRVVE